MNWRKKMDKLKALIEERYEQNVFLLLLGITVVCTIAAVFAKWWVVLVVLLGATHFGAAR